MRSFLKILCILHALSYIQASNNGNQTTALLGPTIVEKKPFNVEADMNDILKGRDQGKAGVKDAADRLLTMTSAQRQQIVDLWNGKHPNEFPGFREGLNLAVDSENRDGPFDQLLFIEQTLLGNYIQSSVDRNHDWGYLSILCTSSKRRLEMINNHQFTVKKKDKNWNAKIDEFIDKQIDSWGGSAVLRSIVSTDPPLRPDNGTDPSKVKEQVDTIPKHHGGCNHATEKKLLKFMTKESFDQIKLVDAEFRKNNDNKSILHQFDTLCTGETRQAYKRIAMYALDPMGYFADEFYVGLTDPKQGQIADAVGIVSTRSEIDLEDIKAAFQAKYKKPLLEALSEYNNPSDMIKYIIYGLYRGNKGKKGK